MLRKYRILLLFFSLLILGLMVGCKKSQIEEISIPNPINDTSSYKILTKPTQFYDTISISDKEHIALFDANSTHILGTKYKDYILGDEFYSETGFSSYSTSLFLYNRNNGNLREIPLDQNSLCLSGQVLDDGRVAFCVITPETTNTKASVIIEDSEGTLLTVYTCNVGRGDYTYPILKRVDSHIYFSFYNIENNSYGISQILDNNTADIVFVSNDMAGFTGNSLKTNGQQYIYYTLHNNVAEFIVGDAYNNLQHINTQDIGSIYSFGLLGDSIYYFFQDVTSNGYVSKLRITNLDGEIMYEERQDPLFRTTSLSSNCFIGNDMDYTIKVVKYEEGIISIDSVDIPSESAFYYPLSNGEVLVDYRNDFMQYEVIIP